VGAAEAALSASGDAAAMAAAAAPRPMALRRENSRVIFSPRIVCSADPGPGPKLFLRLGLSDVANNMRYVILCCRNVLVTVAVAA
jgi:hypothetical protein